MGEISHVDQVDLNVIILLEQFGGDNPAFTSRNLGEGANQQRQKQKRNKTHYRDDDIMTLQSRDSINELSEELFGGLDDGANGFS